MKNLSIYIGIAGALGMAAGDILLLGQPVSGSEYNISSFGALEHISSFDAAIGATVGLVSAFFICFGFWYLKKLFEPVNSKQAMALFIALSSMMFFGAAFHAGCYFLSVPGLWVDPHYPNPIPVYVLNEFKNQLEFWSYLGVPGFVVGTILFFKLALDKRFPTWFKFCNPLIVTGLFLVVLYYIPAPYGGYIRPAFINLGTATVFIISFAVRKVPAR